MTKIVYLLQDYEKKHILTETNVFISNHIKLYCKQIHVLHINKNMG
jgi:hypothetical protein